MLLKLPVFNIDSFKMYCNLYLRAIRYTVIEALFLCVQSRFDASQTLSCIFQFRNFQIPNLK
jgi:hypothetical protein